MAQVYTQRSALPLVWRLVYFLLVGWWLTWLWIHIAWVANLTIIGLPIGLWMLNRVPQVLLLRVPAARVHLRTNGDQAIVWRVTGIPQRFWLWRLIYFILVGWWASLIWTNIAWAFCATLLGLPLGILMLSFLPTVTTLLRTG